MKSFSMIWDQAVKILYGNFSKNGNLIAYDTYIKPLKQEYEDGGTVYISAPSEAVKEMASMRFGNTISDACAEAAFIKLGLRKEFDIKIVTSDELNAVLNEKKLPVKNRSSISLNPSYTFDNFVIGSTNSIASAAAHTVAESPGEAYNPLFIYGGVGLGKTHLLHAIGNEVLKNNPGANVIYITSETFVNEYIDGIQSKNIEKFKNRYRNADVLLIDDIQFISGKEATQVELYHTFNNLYEQQKQIVFTSDKPPTEIPELEERLVSRFIWGLVADIGMPDFETKVAIIRSKLPAILEATKCDMEFSEEVINYIASKEKGNVRDIEGAIKRVIAHAKISGMNGAVTSNSINMPLAESALTYYFVNPERKEATPQDIIRNVCEYFSISESDILSQKRNNCFAFPRQICMYLLRQMLNLAYPKIGELMGGKHYSTVMFAFDKINDRLKGDLELKKTVDNIIHRIKE